MQNSQFHPLCLLGMSQTMASRSVRIEGAGLDEVRQRMAQLEKPRNLDKRGWSQEDLERQAYVSNSTVKRFLKGNPVDRNYAISILKALGFEPIKFIAEHDSNLQNSELEPQPNIAIDWQRVCQEMLNEQQEEQRFRRRATEMGFEINVFVPLGLIERKQQQRRSGNVPMELLHQLEPEVVTRIYEHDEFMTDVIEQNPTGKNKHIAIVGEPGAGKTTLLDKIATHIQENNRDLPICIALASLQGKTLKDYILQEWFPEAMALVYPDIDVEKSHKTSLQKRLRQGGIWLLLDGVDEMAVGANSCLPLEEIRNQLTDWLGNVRVVLTCRTNVWDARLNNPLTGFDTYKTQEFKQEQVDDFIQQWFAEAKNIQQGQELQKKLQEPQKERIRQLVKNPLRLSLLCQIFSKNKQVELPETKAELYQHFVRYFYEWKPSQTVIDWATQPILQEELHQALGHLSIAGLDSDARFRLPLTLIEKEMGDRLFKLAWDLGWLNLVDREAATDEPVYAFFHPIFQEYFASLVIDNYQFFMERYRIFETQWLEVAILWLESFQISALLKKELIDTITNFNEDKWNNLYRLKLLPLNIVYSCQFGDIQFITEWVYWVCLDDNPQTQVYKLMFPGYEEFIIESLKYYASKEACDIINEVINNHTDLEIYDLSKLLEVLFKINPEYECLKVLIPKLLKDDNEGRAIEVATIALKNDNFKQVAVDFLVNALLKEDEQYEIQSFDIVNILMDSKILDNLVIGKLTSFLNSKNYMIQSLAISHLDELSLNHNPLVNNQEILDALINFISQNRDNQISIMPAVSIIKRLDIDISKVNRAIIDLLNNSQHLVIIIFLFDYLETQGFIEEIINNLIKLIANEEDRYESIAYAQMLVRASLRYPKIFDNPSVIKKMICLVESKIDFYYVLIQIFSQTATMYERFKIVGYQSSKDKTFINLISLLIENYMKRNITEELNSTTSNDTENIEDYLIEKQYVEFVSLISDSENLNLTNLMQNSFTGKLLYNCEEIAIAKIKQTNFEVIDKMIEIIQINKDNILRHICIEILVKIETSSKQSIIEKLVNLIVNLKDSQIQWSIAAALQQITHKPQLQRLVFGLKDYVEDAVAKSDHNLYIIAHSVLWHCANHLSYTEFSDACCVQPSFTDLEAFENISIANSSTPQLLLNKVEQSSVLQSAVSHNEELDRAVQLICIDGSEFNPLDNPATDIYIQMVEQGCPERQEGTPTTMPLLKAYWRLNLRNLEKRVALVFYNSKIDREFSEPFLTALSAFGGTIAIITDRPCDNVKRISPNHPNLIDAVLKWLHRSILEA
ncbi:NACHT C-terminal alpha/beta 1 domain-containing protein [Microcoleus sp. B13-B4]|uniref:NACHT C-terminal alpha/beta 1 domain-containing protein n=2 Tax=Microcoleus TaxID=44471 RepID=UPI002FCED793